MAKTQKTKTVSISKPWYQKLWFFVAVLVVFGGIGAYFITKSHAAGRCVDTTLYSGSSGSCVYYAQGLLNLYMIMDGSNTFGRTPRLTLDSSFGPRTQSAVKAFQTWKNTQIQGGWYVKVTADGVIGPLSWQALCGRSYGNVYPQWIMVGTQVGQPYYYYTQYKGTFDSLFDAAGCTAKFGSLR